ncbi:MAG: hypothetical protein AB8I08_27590 [Sandaracinaceae bacterium]
MNLRSRLGPLHRRVWFTIAALGLLSVISTGTAHADAVALLPVDGRAEQERLDEVEQLVSTILQEQGHRLAAPSESSVSRPPASAQMESIANGSNATYVVAAEVEPLRGQYRLHVHVYYAPAGRMEELVATVLEAEERERLSDILSAMVRQAGLGEDALRLTGEPEDPDTQSAEDAAREAREAEEAAAREAEEQAARDAEEQAAREAEERRAAAEAAREADEQAAREAEEREAAEQAFNERVQYGADSPWMAQLQVGGGYAVALGDIPGPSQGGGGLFEAGLRLGRSFEGIDGFELRGGLDFRTGAFTGLGIHVGAAYLASLFAEPFFIGASAEVGVVFTLTGAREAGFSARASALFAWRPVENVYLEVSIPEIGVVTPGTGALTIGASGRVGYRF